MSRFYDPPTVYDVRTVGSRTLKHGSQIHLIKAAILHPLQQVGSGFQFPSPPLGPRWLFQDFFLPPKNGSVTLILLRLTARVSCRLLRWHDASELLRARCAVGGQLDPRVRHEVDASIFRIHSPFLSNNANQLLFFSKLDYHL
jgi:hypothetical protein